MLYYTYYESPVGKVMLLASEEALAGLWLPGQKVDQQLMARAVFQDYTPILEQGRTWLDRYFSGGQPTPEEIPLDPQGSVFRKRVWRRLCKIPYGQVETYGQIARELGAENRGKMSAQAVGGAVGHNPIALIIPCHRVVGASGSLTGYGGGIERKIRLLTLEGVDLSAFSIPSKGTAL